MLARRLCHLRHVATCTTLCCAGLVAYLLRGNGAIRQPDLAALVGCCFTQPSTFGHLPATLLQLQLQLLSHHTCDPYAHLTSLVGWSTHHARHCYDTHPRRSTHTQGYRHHSFAPTHHTQGYPKHAILTTLS